MNPTILVLSADPIVRTVFGEVLERGGYSVLASGDLGTAADMLQQSTPDLLIVCSHISGMSCFDVAKYLRTKCLGLRVLMVGGIIDDDRLTFRMEIERFEIFPTPFTKAELVERVEEVLDRVR